MKKLFMKTLLTMAFGVIMLAKVHGAAKAVESLTTPGSSRSESATPRQTPELAGPFADFGVKNSGLANPFITPGVKDLPLAELFAKSRATNLPPVLNSNSNHPTLGNERNFVRAIRRTGKIGGEADKICDLSLPQQEIEVTESGNYYVYIYVINDIAETVARDVRVRVSTPFGDAKYQKRQTISATITSSNALQHEITSQVVFKSDRNLYIKTEPGSVDFVSEADLQCQIGSLVAREDLFVSEALPKDIVERSGLLVGEGGNIKSGPENMQILRFEVSVCLARDFTWETEISQTDVADEAEVSLTYTNVDDEEHKGVYFCMSLSDPLYINYFVEIVPGSVTLTDKKHPDGAPIKNELGDDFTNEMRGVLGDYKPGEQATVTYRIRSNPERLEEESMVLGDIYNDCYVDMNKMSCTNFLCIGGEFIYESEYRGTSVVADDFLSSGDTFAIKDGQLQYLSPQ